MDKAYYTAEKNPKPKPKKQINFQRLLRNAGRCQQCTEGWHGREGEI